MKNNKLPNGIIESLSGPRRDLIISGEEKVRDNSVCNPASGCKIERTLFIYCNMTMKFYKVTNN